MSIEVFESSNGKAGRAKPITISLGAAVSIVMVCLLPGLGAWFRMEAVVGQLTLTVREISSDLKTTRDDVIRLKAWQEGQARKGDK